MPWEMTDDHRAHTWPSEPRLSTIRKERAEAAAAYFDNIAPEEKIVHVWAGSILAGDAAIATDIDLEIAEEAMVNWLRAHTLASFDILMTHAYRPNMIKNTLGKFSSDLEGRIYIQRLFLNCCPRELIGYGELFFEYEEDAALIRLKI